MKPKNVFFTTIAIIFITLVLLSCGTKDAEFDWPRWRGPNGDGISLETDWNPEALAGGPKILWKTKVGTGHSNVVIKDNRLYTAGTTRGSITVVCLNADTGQEVWRSAFEGGFEINSTPATDGKFVYAISTEGVLVCLQSKNGKLRWKKDLISECGLVKPYYGYGASLVVEGDLLILTANTSGLALDKKTGEIVWDSKKPPEKKHWTSHSTGTDFSTPVMYDYKGKRYAVLSSYEGIHGVDIETGKVLWLYEWEFFRRQVADPLVFDNKVFIAKYAGLGSILLDIKGGVAKILWKNSNMSSDIASPVMIDGYIYGVEGGPEVRHCSVRCLSVESGQLMWEENLGKKAVSLVAADNKLIILEDNGTLHIAEATPRSYKEISRCDVVSEGRRSRLFWTHPVLCNAKIYCKDFAGNLDCIDVSN